jgi:Transcriptional regulator, AbiEi antitoxin
VAVDALIETRIASVARGQGGHVTREQLLALGLSRQSIQRKLAKGQLIPVYRGVYAVGHLPTLPIDRAKGALLAAGRCAVLSQGSAATLWGMDSTWTFPLEVIVPSKRCVPGINVHRSTSLIRTDLRTHKGVRVTSPARTLLDIAPHLSEKRLSRIVNDARIANRLRLADLADVLARFPRHRGAKRLTGFITEPRGPTRSEFEDRFLAFTEQYGLPRPKLNVRVAGYEVDALFESENVIVELDGYRTHSSKASFERDRERDADTLVTGFLTVRITWQRLTTRPAREAERLHKVLSSRH